MLQWPGEDVRRSTNPLTPFPTPEPHRRRTGSHPPPDTARSPPSPPRGSPATLPPALVPASAGMELTRRTRIRKLLQRLPARSSADFEWTPAPREIRRRTWPGDAEEVFEYV